MSEDAEWREKLQPDSLLLTKSLQHIPLERGIFVSRIGNRRTVRSSQPRGRSSAFRRESSLECLKSADEIQCRRGSAEPRGDLARQVFAHAVELLIGIPSVDSIHDEHN